MTRMSNETTISAVRRERVYQIPEVVLRQWHPWFAFWPIKTTAGKWPWMRLVERQKIWMVIFMSEYRDACRPENDDL